MLIGPKPARRLPRNARRGPTAPAAVMAAAAALRGQASCGLEWAAGFEPDGADSRIPSMALHDDGSGPALYVGGHFDSAGGVPAVGIAKWDGTSWSPLGAGTDAGVHALAVFDDGVQPVLYAAGEFSQAGGLPASRIAYWDGVAWHSTPAIPGGGLIVEALCLDVTGGQVRWWSAVARFTVP